MQLRVGRVVVGLQAATGAVLVLAATATTAHVVRLLQVDPGFGGGAALTLRVPVSEARHPTFEARSELVRRMAEELRTIPGVQAAGGTNVLPVGDPDGRWSLSIESRPPSEPNAFEVARGRLVTAGYLEAAGITLVQGRSFDPSDGPDGFPVVVVSRSFAEHFWPDEDPVGMRIKRRTYDSAFPWLTVIGVVSDVRDGGPGAAFEPVVYLLYSQHDTRLGREISYVVRSDRERGELFARARAALQRVDPSAPIIRVAELDDLVRESLSAERTAGRVLFGFALGGLLQLAIGLYGVVARTVIQRRREIGLRRALGAGSGRAATLAFRGGMAPLAGGLVAGLLAGPALVSQAVSVLGAQWTIPTWAFPLAAALVLGVGVLAGALPAIRAVRVSPLEALRPD